MLKGWGKSRDFEMAIICFYEELPVPLFWYRSVTKWITLNTPLPLKITLSHHGWILPRTFRDSSLFILMPCLSDKEVCRQEQFNPFVISYVRRGRHQPMTRRWLAIHEALELRLGIARQQGSEAARQRGSKAARQQGSEAARQQDSCCKALGRIT